MALKKDQIQIIGLTAVLLIIVGMLLNTYWPRLLPQADGELPPPPREELDVPTSFASPLYDRADFKALRGAQGLPTAAPSAIPRNTQIFIDPEQAAQKKAQQ